MIRFIRIMGPLAFAGLIVVILMQASNTNTSGDHSLPQTHTPLEPPVGPIQGSIPGSYTAGIPAIHPSSSSSTPSFTVDDVKAYIPTASIPKLVPVQGSHLTIEEVLFISSKEATQLMQGESPGLPDNALVCFVLLKDPFSVQADYAPGSATSTTQTASEIGEVFDAHTGNLLVWAVLG